MLHTEKTPLLWRKLVRETHTGLSKLGKKSARLNYHGLQVQVPLIYGMGRFHYNPDFSPWLQNNLRAVLLREQKKAVLDIGANVGQFMLNLKSVNAQVPYYGFEPNPACMFYLYELIRRNRFQDTYIFPVGMSTADEINYLKVNAWDSGKSTFRQDSSTGKEGYNTSAYTVEGDRFLGQLGTEGVAFVKIDVEGFELEVMKGLGNLRKIERPVFFCEVLTEVANAVDNIDGLAKEMFALLAADDYLVFRSKGDHTPEAIAAASDFRSSYSQDYVFVPREKEADYLHGFSA